MKRLAKNAATAIRNTQNISMIYSGKPALLDPGTSFNAFL